MRFSVGFFISLSLGVSTYSQNLRGYVVDKETKQPVYYATIYFNGTSVGTYSDRNGCFVLNIANFSTMPLTISALGYFSTTIDNLLSEKQIVVELNRKLIELDEERSMPEINKEYERRISNSSGKHFLVAGSMPEIVKFLMKRI